MTGFEKVSLEDLAIDEMRGRGIGGKNPMIGSPQEKSVSLGLGGGADLDTTLGKKTDVLVPFKARSGGDSQGEV